MIDENKELLEKILEELKKLNRKLDNLNTVETIRPKPDGEGDIPFDPCKIKITPLVSPYVSEPVRINPYDDPNYNPCDTCEWNRRMKTMKEPYVGDSPCQWCRNNPFKVTCSSKDIDVTLKGKGE